MARACGPARETHFSWVFLGPRFVWKLKKPLRHGSVDYRSLARRELGCRDELRLNRRLAPSTYLAVVPLSSGRAGALRLGRGARIEDWVVKMRRLPEATMLDRILRRRVLRGSELRALVARLADFYARAGRAPLGPADYRARLRREIAANRAALAAVRRPGIRRAVDHIVRQQRHYIEAHAPAVGRRGQAVVEAHGDLRPEHVSLARPLQVIDCLEFDRRLRLMDPLEEMAFLALEIERLGRPRLAHELLAAFMARTGATTEPGLLDFYASHRALTRAKLAGWRLQDTALARRAHWVRRLGAYLASAERHLAASVPAADCSGAPRRQTSAGKRSVSISRRVAST